MMQSRPEWCVWCAARGCRAGAVRDFDFERVLRLEVRARIGVRNDRRRFRGRWQRLANKLGEIELRARRLIERAAEREREVNQAAWERRHEAALAIAAIAGPNPMGQIDLRGERWR